MTRFLRWRGRSSFGRISAVCALATITACGSTVTTAGGGQAALPRSATGLGDGSGVDATGLGPDGVAPEAPRFDQAEAEGLGGVSSGTSSAGGALGTDAGSAGSGTTGVNQPVRAEGPSAPTSGRGFTKDTILVGVGSASDGDAFAGALFGDALGDSGDPKAQMKAVVDEINRRGGIAGRKIVMVHHEYETAEVLNNPSAAHEEACATWTQDKQVFAVVLSFSPTPSLLECLKKRDTPFLMIGGVTIPRAYKNVYAKYPDFFNIGGMLYDLFDQLSIERLVARSFFEKWDSASAKPGSAPMKLGLLASDDDNGDIRLRSLRGQLARFGIKDSSVVRCPTTVDGVASCHQSAVLKFRSDGITHVIGAGAFFLLTADNQSYFPRYYIEAGAAVMASIVPHRSLVGSMSSSFLPFLDVNAPQHPGDPSPATGECRKIMQKASLNTTSRSAMVQMTGFCDGFFFLRAATGRAPALTAAGLRAGLESLGGTVSSAITFSTFLAPGNHASTVGVRDLKFVPEKCAGCGDGYYAYVSNNTYTAK